MVNKKYLLFFSLLLLGFFLFTSCLPKPPVTEGILKGQVIVPEGSIKAKDLTGQALPDATVNIIDPLTGAILATTTTDANGYYRVLVLPGGPYLLQAVKEGMKVQQVTPPVEVGKEYDLGTADCTTTAVAMIFQAMLEDDSYPDDPADINLADIEANPDFAEVLNYVYGVLEAGGDPVVSAVVQQAVEDFLHPSTSTPNSTVPAAATAPVIATASTIVNGAAAPTVTVTGTNFKPGIVAADLTVTVGKVKNRIDVLRLDTVSFVSTTEITVAFTGKAAAGDVITIQAKTSAFDPAGVSASNTLTITVPEPAVINIAAIPGVTAPVVGAVPVPTITATVQYTGTVTWAPVHNPFQVETIYTATITLTAKAGYTLTGVVKDFFTVAGATATNDANSGVVTAIFPITLVIGADYQGGKIAYILVFGDPGYDASVQHGLIAATADATNTMQYSNITDTYAGTTGTLIGTGSANTTRIVNQVAAGSSVGTVTISDDTALATLTASQNNNTLTYTIDTVAKNYTIASAITTKAGFLTALNTQLDAKGTASFDAISHLKVVSATTGTLSTVVSSGTAKVAIVGASPTEVTGACTSGAAYYCYNLIEGGHDDWFLPSKDELAAMRTNLASTPSDRILYGFADYLYWSSSEYNAIHAWNQSFNFGNQYYNYKYDDYRVRAVRVF